MQLQELQEQLRQREQLLSYASSLFSWLVLLVRQLLQQEQLLQVRQQEQLRQQPRQRK